MNRSLGYVVVIGLLCLSVSADAQVRRTEPGRALDASYQLGSGGINQPGRTRDFGSRHLVTGQVTGLHGFRGRVGYRGTDELRLVLPSDSFSRFQRQSVGLSGALGGATHLSRTFLDPYKTTYSLGSPGAGRVTSEGVRAPMTTVPGDVTQRLFVDAMVEYRPVMRVGRNLADPSTAARPEATRSYVPTDASQRLAVRQALTTTDSLRTAAVGGTELFGMLRMDARARLARELRELDQPRDDLDLAVNTRVGGDEPIQPIESDPKGVSPADPSADTDPDEARVRIREGMTMPGANQDVFLDLLLTFRQSDSKARPLDVPGRAHPPSSRALPRKVELTEDRTILVRSLAGESPDLFNQYMKRGEKLLKAGRFYQAEKQYQQAALCQRASPRMYLARLGEGLAMFGAGEFYSAALRFEEALRRFPRMMETRLDLPQMMPAKDIEKRLDFLDAWIENINDRPAVLFVGAFINQNYGREEKAKVYAKRLAEMDGIDDLMKAYAQYVLTGKRPSDKPDKSDTPAIKAPAAPAP